MSSIVLNVQLQAKLMCEKNSLKHFGMGLHGLSPSGIRLIVTYGSRKFDKCLVKKR